MKSYRISILWISVLAVLTALSAAAELTPETVLATSDAGNVVFADVEENWPYLGSETEKMDLVRKAILERIYAAEAVKEGLDRSEEYAASLEDARMSAFLEAMFLLQHGPIQVTDEEIRKYYEERQSLYFLDEHLFLKYIVIVTPNPSDSTSRLESHTRAIEALARLKSGEDFDAVARQYATDPNESLRVVGPVPVKDVPRGWGSQVAGLQEGQVSDVIDLDGQFLIVKAIERNPAGQQPYEKVRLAIRSKLAEENARSAKEEFITRLLGSIPVKKIDHQAIEDPQAKPGATVIDSKVLKMSKEDFLRWAQQQNPTTQRALRDPMGREAIIRKNLLLKPWVESQAAKDNLEKDPEFVQSLEKQTRFLLAERFEKSLLARNPSFLEVTSEDLNRYYNAHVSSFKIPRKAEIRDIIVKAETDLSQEPQARTLAMRYAREKAAELQKRIQEGKITFDIAAYQHDTSFAPGSYFSVDEGTQAEPFDEVVFQLQPGQFAPEPLPVENGYRIVQLNKIIPEVQLPLSRVQDRIFQLVQKEKEEKLTRQLEETYFQKANAKIIEEAVGQ